MYNLVVDIIMYNLAVDISEYNLKDTIASTTVPSDMKMFVQQREIGKWTALDDEKLKELGLREEKKNENIQ